MDVLEALGGWRNINQEKLEQIKVDNPPLYDAITKAINLLAKKYGGEDIIIQKPIEENLLSTELSDLEKSILLSQRRGTESSFKEIFDSVEKVALQKFQLNISYLGLREKLEAIEKLVEDGYLNKIVSSAYGNAYILTEKGEDAVNKIISDGVQPPQETPSDEDLKLEILTRMTDYYDGGDYNLLNQDDIITNAVKHQFDIPSNKYFGLVVKLLGDGFVEKDPSGLTDSIRLTNKGYDKAMDWFEENLPEEEEEANQYNLPQDRLEGILKRLSEARAKIHDYVSIEDLKRQLYDVMVPINYAVYEKSGEPSLERDLKIMEDMGLVRSRKYMDRNTTTLGGDVKKEYDIDTKGGVLLAELKIKEAQQKASSLRPSPTESATLFSTGRIKVGNDGNLWKVTETKNGVKRWTKVGDTPSELPDQTPVETPISEIDEDEVDLDILEQQLNDDSLEFDISDEDLENLEF